jgi:putative glycosyltransferase (TIGR04372 family)
MVVRSINRQKTIESFQLALEEARKPETMDALIRLITPRIMPNKKNLVYVLTQIDRIGQLAGELWHIKTIFGPHYDRIIVVTKPLNAPYVNANVFKVVGPKFINVVTENTLIPLIGALKGNHFTLSSDLDLLIWDAHQVWGVFRKVFIQGTPLASFQLPNSMRLKGEAWMREVGLDPNNPTVLLHVRDIGYRPELSHHGHRCADISNYRLAIEVLIKKGYQVVRIGDPSNKPLKGYPKTLVDLPHHPLYESFLDIYFCAVCVFAVNQSSGPSTLLGAFEKPVLMVNRVVDWDINPPQQVLLFKHYIRTKTGEELTYRQILEEGLDELTMDEEFEHAGFNIEENTPEELKVAVEEFVEVLEGNKNYPTERRIRFNKIGRNHEKRIANTSKATSKKGQCFGFAYSKGNFSERAPGLNRHFLK